MIGIILILLGAFVALLIMNAPVAVAIAVASMLAILASGGDAAYTVAQRMANGVDSFPLLAIPFFVFSGYIMGRGGLGRVFVSPVRGDLPRDPVEGSAGLCLQTGITTAMVMLLIGASSAMSWIMTVTNIPQTVSAALMGLSDNPYIILLTINAMLLVVGMFMDMTPALLIFTPILLPVVRGLGLSDIHFGIIIIANLCIGLCTPPVGTCLFIACGVGETTIAKAAVEALPFFLAMIVALMLITYIPWISLAIPKMCGLLK